MTLFDRAVQFLWLHLDLAPGAPSTVTPFVSVGLALAIVVAGVRRLRSS